MARRGETADIRSWLRENRPDLGVQVKGQLSSEAVSIYREANGTGSEPEAVPVLQDPGEGFPGGGEVSPVRAGQARRSWMSRKVSPEGGKPARRRVSIDGIVSGAWGVASHFLASPATLPVARCMKYQAPAAGMVLDEALRGGMIDKALQPFARAGKRGEAVFSLIGPPMMVAAITQQPELYPVLRPLLRQSLSSWLVIAGPKIRKAQEREAKLLAELGGDITVLDDLIDSMFAPPSPAEMGMTPDGEPEMAAA